jgi:predicted MFS family arabinose efflux permease
MIRQTLLLYRNAYSGLSPSIWMQALVMLINRSGTMVIPFLTVYLTGTLHFSIAQSGIVLSVFGGGSIIGVYAGGKLTDNIGFFPVQFWSLFVNGLLFLVMSQLHSFWFICGCIFLLACIGEAFRPANSAATAHYSLPENRTRSYSLNRLAINLGFAIGPAAGGLLASISFGWLFWTDGLTCIGAALLLQALLRPQVQRDNLPAQQPWGEAPEANLAEALTIAAPPPTADVAPAPEAVRSTSAYKDKTYLIFIFFVWLNGLCFFQYLSIVPLYYQRVIHMNSAQIGLILSMNGLLIVLVEMVLVYRLENKRPDRVYISYGVLLIAASFLALLVGGAWIWVAVVSMLLLTIGEMMSMPFMNAYWISCSTLQSRGQYAALYAMAYSAAQVVGPFVGALIAEHLGFNALWGVVAALGIITGWGFRYRVR